MKVHEIKIEIEEELFNEIKRYSIDVGELAKKALLKKIKHEKKKRMKLLEKASRAIKKIGIKQIVKDIREIRESR